MLRELSASVYTLWCVSILSVLAAKHPHIIILLADDLGHDDVGFLGSKQIPTPNLDALAYDGIILNEFYVQRICTPSRAALMTGRHPTQLGLQHDVILGSQKFGLGLNETLLPEYLKKLGYSTHAFGKWHLGFYAKEFTPLYRGFDTFYGFLQGREDYWDHTFKRGSLWGLDLRDNENIVKTRFGEYGTDIFTEEVVKVIQNHDRDTPLFVYLPQQGVHAGNEETRTPLEAPWKYLKKFSHISNKQRALYAGMVSAVDESMGQIVRALADRGMLEESVIFFSTDNGGPAAGFDMNQACNWPLRGMKYTLWEGGVRGASFIWSPLLKTSSYVSEHRIQIEDMLPTLLHVAGYNTTTLPAHLYGINMWDMLSDNSADRRNEIFHNFEPVSGVKGIRVGDMKLVVSPPSGATAQKAGWYRPPTIDQSCQISQLNTSDGDITACDQTDDWTVSPGAHDGLHNYQSEIPNMEDFQTDLPDILHKIGRPERAHKPHIISCSKVIVNKTCDVGKKPCLFNISADPCEYNDLSEDYPHIVDELAARLAEYGRQAAPPKNKPNDPKGDPKYHNGIWEPWVNLTESELTEMMKGKHI